MKIGASLSLMLLILYTLDASLLLNLHWKLHLSISSQNSFKDHKIYLLFFQATHKIVLGSILVFDMENCNYRVIN